MASSGEVDMLKAAQRVWDTLDQMSADDPERYKKFITEQLEEGKEVMAVPEPVFCLRCALDGTKMRYLYLNVCKWTRVPRPKTDEDSIPVKGGVLRHLLYKDSAKKTRDMLYDVAFNPHVLEECMKESQLNDMLISLCLDYVKNEVKLSIPDKKSCMKISASHKGPVDDMRSSIDENWRHCLRPETLPDIGDSILSQLREMKANDENKDDSSLPHLKLFPSENHLQAKNSTARIRTTEGGNSLEPKSPSSQQGPIPTPQPSGLEEGGINGSKRKLIEELRSDVLASYEDTENGEHVCIPEHSMCVTEKKGGGVGGGGGGGGGGKVVIVRVTLPGINSVKEVDLEVSETDLVLSVDDDNCYQLHLVFPELVLEGETRATFSSKQALLTVTIPCSK